MRRLSALLALAFCFQLALAETCTAQAIDGLVTFGDSLSDMGNRSVETRKPDIKFRENWVKVLAGPGLLNVPDFKPSGMSYYYGGTNYAVGGATTEATAAMNKDRNRGQHLTQQVSKRYLNPAFNKDGVKKNALHVIVIGTNDLMLASIGLDQIATKWAKLDAVGVAVAKSTESQIQALAGAGVRHVMWGDLFDVAQAPSVAMRAKPFGVEVSGVYLAAITRAVQAHNTEMDAAIARLQKANPGLTLTKLDLHARFADVAKDPAKYGFVEVTKGANDDKHLFSADGLHPTTQAHKMLAQYAYEVLMKPVAQSAQ
ncbi:phospholipase/lecithinase/hemolysin [Roseimicrobium gellanilyticum]|uniref:Phospholipase/lecithinase/hemolysin n=1 Tax=Roseimicrobium gellanilyticum TaxID=748857 RepID=A0A366HSI9_9BACT|nr:SGNH/GDSL hydrolase family protein [Roseimicrobium gellanilyticum]RBP45667.1 phospholipase/lecithinase/hemolysin [Roseimicrobium gellanilyticum]